MTFCGKITQTLWAALLLQVGLLLAVVSLTAPSVRAVTVIPPSFNELVERSTQILRVKVLEVTSRWDDAPNGRVINTYVRCQALKTLKGADEPIVTLRFLGGTVDGFSMQVADMPLLEAGQIYVVFTALNGVAFCPLVGVMHGSYPVAIDAATNTEYMTRVNREPLRTVDDVSLPITQSNLPMVRARSGPVMTRAAFEDAIAKEVARAVQ